MRMKTLAAYDQRRHDVRQAGSTTRRITHFYASCPIVIICLEAQFWPRADFRQRAGVRQILPKEWLDERVNQAVVNIIRKRGLADQLGRPVKTISHQTNQCDCRLRCVALGVR